jgi:antitoxin PrlF
MGVAIAKSRLTSQGQISIPAEVRRKLGLSPGSVVEWEAHGDQVLLRRAGTYTFEDMHRALFSGDPPRPKSLEDLKAGIGRHMRQKHARR